MRESKSAWLELVGVGAVVVLCYSWSVIFFVFPALRGVILTAVCNDVPRHQAPTRLHCIRRELLHFLSSPTNYVERGPDVCKVHTLQRSLPSTPLRHLWERTKFHLHEVFSLF